MLSVYEKFSALKINEAPAIKNTVNSIKIESTDYRPPTLEDKIRIVMYKNYADSNKVDKTPNIDYVGDVYGVFREGTSILNITVDMEFDSFPTFNYVYIEIFNRYYFVNDIEFINNRLYTIYMSVDVLMSHKDAILQTKAFVDRNEKNFNPYIIDDNRVFEQGCDIEIVEIENTILKGEYTYVLEIANAKVQTYEGIPPKLNYMDTLIENLDFEGEYE